MKIFLYAVFIGLLFTVCTYAQDPVPAQPAVAAQSAPSMVSVAEPSAPPQWAQDIITAASKLPVVGPYVSKIEIYLGIISAILTTLVGTILAILSILSGITSLAPSLAGITSALENFKGGQVMYYLKFFSMFNAKTPTSSDKTSG